MTSTEQSREKICLDFLDLYIVNNSSPSSFFPLLSPLIYCSTTFSFSFSLFSFCLTTLTTWHHHHHHHHHLCCALLTASDWLLITDAVSMLSRLWFMKWLPTVATETVGRGKSKSPAMFGSTNSIVIEWNGEREWMSETWNWWKNKS